MNNSKDDIYEREAYGCYLKKNDDLLESSSGGAFFAFASCVLKIGGIVYGVSMSEDFHIQHKRISRSEELHQLRKSKYAQSRIGDSYSDAQKDLDNNLTVLFSGTPCQIAGLHSFLRKKYDNLICVDIICQGVPSNHMFIRHIHSLKTQYKRVDNFQFRSKKKGWNPDFQLQLTSNTDNELLPAASDTYMYSFFRFYSLRRSCYNCQFRCLTSGSDITVGDFWGVERICPDIYNPNGVSAVIINSEKGRNIFQHCSHLMAFHPVTVSAIVSQNKFLIETLGNIPARDMFFNYYNMTGHNLTDTYELVKNINNIKISLIGSYSLRLIAHHLQDYCLEYNLCWQLTGQTIYSMVSSPVNESYIKDIKFSNSYRKQMVRNDLGKSLIEQMESAPRPQYLLIDLLEERYGIFQLDNNGVVTNNEALQETSSKLFPKATYMTPLEIPLILWEKQCLKLIDLLKKYYNSGSVILIKLFLTEYYGYSEESRKRFDEYEYIKQLNDRLLHYYEFFENHMPGIRIIELDNSNYNYCSQYFEYGCTPFYYNEKVYNELAKKIYTVTKKQT